MNPVAEAGRLCRAAGVPLLVDACQSVGQLPIDVDQLGCDVLTSSGRKFLRGPRGSAFLYVRSAFLPRLEPRLLELQGATWVAPDRFELLPHAGRFEQYDGNVAGRIALGVAADHAMSWGIEAIAERNRHLAEGLRARLAELPGVTVQDKGAVRSAITTFTIEGVPAADVTRRLHAEGVNVRASTATQAQLDLGHRGVDAVVRASVHYVTTDEELDHTAKLVRTIARG